MVSGKRFEILTSSKYCSKPSLIRINWGGEVIRINEVEDMIKDKKKLTKQINGKCNNTGSADENR
jgi:hypothetical protein